MYAVRYGSELRMVWGCFPTRQEAFTAARGVAAGGQWAAVFTPAGRYAGCFYPCETLAGVSK